jgi:predicted metal-dependent phosphoesterase TrpH
LFKADFHIHSKYSLDCKTTLEKIIQSCQKKNINCIALSDHGSIEGALKLKSIASFYVIIAEEVLTTEGEIMGMFLQELVPSGLSMDESIRRIKAQGGLLCAQHPYDKFRSDALKAEVLEKIADQVDVVEVFNSRNPLLRSSQQARTFADKHHLPHTAGSDAHAANEIGNAYVELPEFKGRDDFLQALAQGTVYGHRTNWLSRLSSVWARITNS